MGRRRKAPEDRIFNAWTLAAGAIAILVLSLAGYQ